MTPRELDWRSIERKLARIRQYADQLAALGPFDAHRFEADAVAGLAAERLLTLLVELSFGVNGQVAVAIVGQAPDSYLDSFRLAGRIGMLEPDLAEVLARAAGLRNVLVHAYLDVDYVLVAEATRVAPDHFGEYVRQVARWFAARSDGPTQADD